MRSQDHQLGVHVRQPLGCGSRTGLGEQFEPRAEPTGIEALVRPWLIDAPQVEVENGGQLFGGGHRQKLAALLEPTTLNQAVKQLRGKSRHRARQMRRFRNASQQGARAVGFRHGSAMIPTLSARKQSGRKVERQRY